MKCNSKLSKRTRNLIMRRKKKKQDLVQVFLLPIRREGPVNEVKAIRNGQHSIESAVFSN